MSMSFSRLFSCLCFCSGLGLLSGCWDVVYGGKGDDSAGQAPTDERLPDGVYASVLVPSTVPSQGLENSCGQYSFTYALEQTQGSLPDSYRKIVDSIPHTVDLEVLELKNMGVNLPAFVMDPLQVLLQRYRDALRKGLGSPREGRAGLSPRGVNNWFTEARLAEMGFPGLRLVPGKSQTLMQLAMQFIAHGKRPTAVLLMLAGGQDIKPQLPPALRGSQVIQALFPSLVPTVHWNVLVGLNVENGEVKEVQVWEPQEGRVVVSKGEEFERSFLWSNYNMAREASPWTKMFLNYEQVERGTWFFFEPSAS